MKNVVNRCELAEIAKMQKKKVTHGVSWPNEELLEKAKQRADQLGLNLSAYINQLVRKDLGWGGVFSAPPITGASQPRDLSQTEHRVDKAILPREPVPLKYARPDEPHRLVAEDGPTKRKPR